MEVSEDYVFGRMEEAIRKSEGLLCKMELFRMFRDGIDYPTAMPIVRGLVSKGRIVEQYLRPKSAVLILKEEARDNTTFYSLPQ